MAGAPTKALAPTIFAGLRPPWRAGLVSNVGGAHRRGARQYAPVRLPRTVSDVVRRTIAPWTTPGSEIYSAFLVEDPWRPSACAEAVRAATRGCPAAGLQTVAADYEARWTARSPRIIGRIDPSISSASSTSLGPPRPPADSRSSAPGRRTIIVKALALAGIATVEAADRFIAPYARCRQCHPARADGDSHSCPSSTPRPDRRRRHRPHGRRRDDRSTKGASSRSPSISGRTSISPSSTGTRCLAPLHHQREPIETPNPRGRNETRRRPRSGVPVDKWTAGSAPDHSPQGHNNRTGQMMCYLKTGQIHLLATAFV